MSGHKFEGGEEMTYTDQLLHMLDDFDTAGGMHITNGTRLHHREPYLWKVTLSKSAGSSRPTAWIVMICDGFYAWGTTIQEAQGSHLHAPSEQILELVKEYLHAADGANRLRGA